MDRHGITESLARKKQIRVSGQVGRDLLDLEIGSRNDRNDGRVFIADQKGIRRTIHIRIITVRKRNPDRRELRLIRNVGCIGDDRSQGRLEFNHDRVVQPSQRHSSDIDDARPIRSSIGIGLTRIRARGRADELERSRDEDGNCVERVDYVQDAQIVDRNIAEILPSKSVAEDIARPGERRGIFPGRHVHDGLLEEEFGPRDQRRVGIFVIEDRHRPVGHDAREDAAIGLRIWI